MTITICGSMQFHKEMMQTKLQLESKGFIVLVPKDLDNIANNESYMETDEERINAKIEFDFIREHFRKIEKADAIFVLNYEKNGLRGYIGGNTFLEMGYAYGLGKKIYLLYPIPEMDYKTEMHAMRPIVIDSEIERISS
jgi:nucleoside 2-deoxyribosyltransferase